MAGGPLQAADDMIRIISNGLTFGAADRIASAMGERDAAAKTAAARERAGIAGDLASVLGLGGGAKVAFTLGKGALRAIPKVAPAVLSKKGAGAALLGLAGLAEYNGRTSGDAQAAPKPAARPAAASAPAKSRSTVNADAAADSIMAALRAVDSQPVTFDDMVQQTAAANGGISLRQLGALSEVARNTASKTKTPRATDAVLGRLATYYDGLHEQEIASGVPQAEADARWAQRYEGLAKMNPLDALIRNGDEED